MSIEYTNLSLEHLDDVKDLMLPIWERRWGEDFARAFFRWRFFERPLWDAALAYDGTSLVAFLDSFIRRCRVGTQIIPIRQTADWFCHPDYRPVVGIKIMRMMMDKPEPMLVVGGNKNTQNVLPRLRWHSLPDVPRFVLPIGPGVMFKGLSRLLRIPTSAFPSALGRLPSFRVFGGRRGAAPNGTGSVFRLRDSESLPEIAPPPDSCALGAVLDREEVDWLNKAPDAMGDFVWLVFSIDGSPMGLSLSRVYEEKPFRTAKLLHLQATDPSAAAYDWMIKETAAFVAECGAQWITAQFGDPLVLQALEKTGYRKKRDDQKAFWWNHGQEPPNGPYHLTWVCGDESVMPFPD